MPSRKKNDIEGAITPELGTFFGDRTMLALKTPTLKSFSQDGYTEDQRLKNTESLWRRAVRPEGFDVQAYANKMRADSLRRNNGIGMIGYQFDVTFEGLKDVKFEGKKSYDEIKKQLQNGFVLKGKSGTGKTLTLLAALNHFRSPTCKVMLTSGAAFDGDFKFSKHDLLNVDYLAIDDLEDLRHEAFSAKLFTQFFTVLGHREAKGLVTFIACSLLPELWGNERFENKLKRVGQIFSWC